MNTKPKILIVDDRPENLVALETVLKNLDIELVRATSGNEALKATLYHDFTLALLDIQMPEMDGYELAGILREEEKTAQLPFIFISAVYTDNLNVFKGYEKGAFSFITKPFQPEILINKVKFFIEKYQQEIALYEMNQSLEKKNAELEFINRELEAFTYSVSHDLRAPLRSLNGYAAILREDYGDKLDEEGKRILGIIKADALKMSSLIDSLLSLSRLGRNQVDKVSVDMNELVQSVLTQFHTERLHPEPRIVLGKLPPAGGERELLRQVFVNLVSNAIKYSAKKEKPVITISGQHENGSAVYCVRDNGAGFSMEYKEKLFGIFQRLHSVNEFDGIGIGLAIVQRIVLRHGGKTWAEGEEHQGAAFYFSLPVD